MDLVVDPANLGTKESAWQAAFSAAAQIREWSWGSPEHVPEHVVVIAPHPDDEVLALGGSLMRLARAGTRIDIVAVTRGEASHPRSRRYSPSQIAELRNRERSDALAALAASNARIIELGLPDGGVNVSTLVDRLAPLVRGASYCAAPWWRDGHPDHDASGAAASVACAKENTRFLEYLVWGWHWATPKTADFPWSRLHKVSLRADEHHAKMQAIAAYRSQIAPLSADEPDVILPPEVLQRFRRPFEMVLA